jgi:hypothetical protein
MPSWGVFAFFAVFFGAAVLIIVASRKERKVWAARPAILRAMAARRGYRVVENPGKPSEIVPIRPLDKAPDLNALELPVAVSGRTLDGDFTLFDVYHETQPKYSKNRGRLRSYETFITIKSDGKQWPHFELMAMPVAANSLTGKLLEMTSSLAEGVMRQRGLVHVPTPDHPGFQLYVESASDGAAFRDRLMPIFTNRGAWWVGGLDDALTLQRANSASRVGPGSLIAEKDLDRFVDEAFEIERAARTAIR